MTTPAGSLLNGIISRSIADLNDSIDHKSQMVAETERRLKQAREELLIAEVKREELRAALQLVVQNGL